jgi:hypothetical protein
VSRNSLSRIFGTLICYVFCTMELRRILSAWSLDGNGTYSLSKCPSTEAPRANATSSTCNAGWVESGNRGCTSGSTGTGDIRATS